MSKSKSSPGASLAGIVQFLDRLLRPSEFKDWEGAVNGLQVENEGTVLKVAACVDASLVTLEKSARAGANLMLVHHGLFWGPSHPWTGRRFRLIREIVRSGMAVYSSHLPLDAHPVLGNNSQLAKALGLRKAAPFFLEKGAEIGLKFECRLSRGELAARLSAALGEPPLVLPNGPKECRRIGIVTGGAGAELRRAAAAGVDTFITGEGPHWTFALSEDLGLNVFYGGHYLTETFGVRALAARVGARFGLPWVFVDHPSGL